MLSGRFWLVLLSGIFCTAFDFLGNEMDMETFRTKAQTVDRILRDGHWTRSWNDKNWRPLFDQNCHGVDRYKYGKCIHSHAAIGKYWTWTNEVNHNDPLNNNHVFNNQHFCKMMNGRNILIVGDSLLEQWMFTLISAMHAQIILDSQINSNTTKKEILEAFDASLTSCISQACAFGRDRCDDDHHVDCGHDLPGFNISFVFSTHLASPDGSASNISWVDEIRNKNASLLILNTGAHSARNGAATIEKHLIPNLQKVAQRYPSVNVIYRNSARGHLNCVEMVNNAPLHTPQVVTPALEKEFFNAEFGWSHFDDMNTEIRNVLENQFPQYIYLDSATALNLRADSHTIDHIGEHIDCLHYCMPGPLDESVAQFYRALIVLTGMPPPKATVPLHRQLNLTLPRQVSAGGVHLKDDEFIRHGRFSSKTIWWFKWGKKRFVSSADDFIKVANGREFSDVKRFNSKLLVDLPVDIPLGDYANYA